MTAESRIHPTAIIHPGTSIGEGVEIGPHAVIGESVILHPRVQVGPHAVVEYAEVGEACRIFSGACVGTAPQDLKYRGEPTRLVLGPGCIVREYVTLNRGTSATGLTRIGARCLFMAYAHVAHDCMIGDEVIMANCVMVAGHVEVQDWVILGGGVGLHQFVRVGKLAMVGAGAMVPVDIPPFSLAWGDRARLSGLNLIGLKRRGYSHEATSDLKRAYRELYGGALPMKEQIARLAAQPRSEAVRDLVAFLQKAGRGITRPESRSTLDS